MNRPLSSKLGVEMPRSPAGIDRHVERIGPSSDTTEARDLGRTGAAIRAKPCLCSSAFLVVQMIIGYEWLMSGLVKLVRGDFPSGLGAELSKKLPDMVPWYGAFIKSVAIPNAILFAYFIEISELLAGLVLIVGPLVWLVAWNRISDGPRSFVLVSIAAAAIGGAFLAINLHIANGGNHPWVFPNGSFDEGIDLDSVLPAIQIMIATVCIIYFGRLQRTRSVLVAPGAHTSANL